MKRIFNINKNSKNNNYDDLDEEEIKRFLQDFDFFVYSYEVGYYDGSGNSIFKKDGLYYEYGLGHCSCNGPLDYLELTGGKPTLEKLLGNCSEGLNEELKLIVKKIKQIERRRNANNQENKS